LAAIVFPKAARKDCEFQRALQKAPVDTVLQLAGDVIKKSACHPFAAIPKK
jgi:hypothetical protein